MLAVSQEGPLNGVDQCGFRHRLCQDIFSAGLDRLHAGLNAPVPGQEKDRQPGADFVQPLLQIESVEFRHTHVEQYATWFYARRICEKLLTGFMEHDLVASSPEQPSNRDAKRWIVVDYVDGCRSRGHPGRAGGAEYPPRQLRLSTQNISSQAREEPR